MASMLYRWQQDDVVLYRSPVLDALGVPHGFGTRQGDEHAAASALDLSHHTRVIVRQVHGVAVHVEASSSVNNGDSPYFDGQGDTPRCDADAIVLARPDAYARILTADCVPVLLASADGRSVAAVHAGWRGLVAGVIERAADALASPLVAAIGPCISAAHFEIGPEVAERFDDRFVRLDLGEKPHIDLRAAVHDRLTRLGAGRIDTTDRCTYAHEADFFSHRRDVTHRGMDTTGRMLSLIAPKPGV